ncbi:polysaccharide biosynthesis protein vipA/tviB [Exophiala viscosa]|uniref:Polysaccharide biosynthesis protein vipA/tviB n=1 Tax=Exophiala viscosa TaxID=2486360 RepID=A0AAN6DTY8_9EURO|nr:polysaccharide biosynthesis protein vipA/tviB [Exophiala viscosa]KAI1623843.1 polysaccharide biosynthesis protein vipA/tviB [Exophiala viscosa]
MLLQQALPSQIADRRFVQSLSCDSSQYQTDDHGSFTDSPRVSSNHEAFFPFDLNRPQDVWMSSSDPLTADTPPPEAYFSSPRSTSSTPVNEDEPALVAVIGVGYVGIQLVTAFAEHYRVIAFDISEKRINTVAQTLKAFPSITCTTNPTQLADATHFLLAVPTILHPDKRIDTSHLRAAVYTVGLYARPKATIVIESSVAVGMTRRLLTDLMVVQGLRGGMSPERVDPGRAIPGFTDIPKVISGLDDISYGSLDSITRLYSKVFASVIPVSSPEVAEMTKLYENCQRMVCIAYANEMADACIAHGIDPYEVCKAAASKPFGYMPYTPGLGVGGHCIPVNPYYLLSNSTFPVLRLATERMWSRPSRLCDELMEAFLKSKTGGEFSKHAPRVLVVGVGFKRGQSGLSHSPAVSLIQRLLDQWEAHVTFVDPLVKEQDLPYVPRLDEHTEWNKESLEMFDIIVVALKQVSLDLGVLEVLQGGVQVVTYCP